jgi:hypothetical protein
VSRNINSNFIALIPKTYSVDSFDEYHPISLCNMIYKIVSNLTSLRLKIILSRVISDEKFGFLQDRKIHEAVGTKKEELHIIKSKN